MKVVIKVELVAPNMAQVSVLEGSSNALLYQAVALPDRTLEIELQGEGVTMILPGSLYPLRVK